MSEVRLALDNVIEQYRVDLEIPDPAQIYAILGAMAANHFNNSHPVWLVVVGPPSSGKSDPLKCLDVLPAVQFASEVSQGGLLSCSPRKERNPGSTGGLLTKMGAFGILVISDMSPTLSMHPENLGKFLSLMRDVYDGRVIRHAGQDGGQTREWTGKMGLIAAATGDIDRHHSVINALGDRYLYFRMPAGNINDKMWRAHGRKSNAKAIRAAIASLFGFIAMADQPEIAVETAKTLQGVAKFVAITRTAVIREGVARTIEFLPQPEEPVRLYLVLKTLYCGLIYIGLSETEAMGIVTKVALDSLPPARLMAIKTVLGSVVPATMKAMMGQKGDVFSETTVRRALEDLECFRVLTKVGENGIPAHYYPSDWLSRSVAELPEGTFSEISSITLEEEEKRPLSSIEDVFGVVADKSEKVGDDSSTPTEK